jgi:hypothetical protein
MHAFIAVRMYMQLRVYIYIYIERERERERERESEMIQPLLLFVCFHSTLMHGPALRLIKKNKTLHY